MRDISALHPTLIAKLNQLVELCNNNGITIGISECLRTVAEQDALYAKGRTAAGSIVTNCKGSSYSSMHQWGVAFDFYLKMDVDGDGQISDDSYNNSTKLFNKVGALGQSIGLEWGGSWTSPVDLPHFQLPDWGSTATKLKAQYGTPDKFIASWGSASTSTTTTTQTSTAGTTAHQVGEVVTVSSYYNASSDGVDKAIIKTLTGVTIGKVLEGARNPYRLDKSGTAMGWCNDGDIRSVTTAAPVVTASVTTTNSASTETTTTTEYSKSVVEAAKCKNAQFAGTYTTTANLNLRVGAGTGKGVIITIKAGETVQCYGYYTEVSGTAWYLVSYGKYIGFCSSKYLLKK